MSRRPVPAESTGAWSPADLDSLRRMRAAGVHIVTIANTLGRSTNAVRHKIWGRGVGKHDGRIAPEKITTADGPPIAEPTRWIKAVEDGRFAVLMAGRRFEDREIAKAPMGSLKRGC